MINDPGLCEFTSFMGIIHKSSVIIYQYHLNRRNKRTNLGNCFSQNTKGPE